MKGDCPILYLCNPSFNHSNHFLVVKNTGIEKVMNQMLDWEMLLKKVNKWVKSDKIKAEKKRKADVRAEKSGRPKQAAAGSNTNYKWQKTVLILASWGDVAPQGRGPQLVKQYWY